MNSVIEYFRWLLKPNDTIIVATSGGPDSMCLLNLLCDFSKNTKINIIVAHVNHKLRSESDEEEVFVRRYAKDNNCLYESMIIKEYTEDNLESEARMKRYAFFQKLVHKYQAKYLMTAHHGDDLIETIMMRLVRGSSLKGYRGFLKENDMGSYKLIRPLISLTKDDIINYMDEHNYKYYLDKSNESIIYTRNRYRKFLLPFLKKENPLVHLKFLKFSNELTKAYNFIDNYVKDIILRIKDNNGLNIKKLQELDSFLLTKVIEYELSLIYINDLFLVSDRNRDEIIKLIFNKKNSGITHLPGDYIVIKEYETLKFVHNIKVEAYHYILNDEVKLRSGVIKRVVASNKKSNYIIRLNSKDIELPIHIRSREPGDKMEVKNLHGTKKVKDILIDDKIIKEKREGIPIVTDNKNRIIWIPGVKKSKFDVEIDGLYDIILAYEEEL